MSNGIQADRNTVAVLKSHQNIELEAREIPTVGPGDVLIKVMAVGVCGSDIHYYEHGKIGQNAVQYPIILGHECAGVVLQVGENTGSVKVGDRVVVEPGIPCLKCINCKSGKYNLCPNVQFLSAKGTDGAFCQYLVHPEHLVHLIPDEMDFDVATLVEPLSVGIHACRRGELQAGQAIHISGLGPVGLMLIIAAKSAGAETIIVSDIEPSRLETAKRLGATKTILVGQDDFNQEVLLQTGGEGVDIAFDTSGHDKMIVDSIDVIKRGGSFVAIGFPRADHISLKFTQMLMKEIDIKSVYRYTNTFPQGISILSHCSDVDGVLTDRFPLYETADALNRAITNKESSIKVVVYPNGMKEEERV